MLLARPLCQILEPIVARESKSLPTSGVDKEELSSMCTKTFKGNFLRSDFTSLSTFKADLLSHCSSTTVYDYTTFIQCN